MALPDNYRRLASGGAPHASSPRVLLPSGLATGCPLVGRTGHAAGPVESAVMRATTPTTRLQAVAQAISATPTAVVADVATGRAELAIFLAAKGMCAKVIACDRSPMAVATARRLVSARGLDGRVEVRLGDGLSVLLPGEADVVVVAGVGARLMVRMLGDSVGQATGLARLRSCGVEPPDLVLQPMSEPGRVREWVLTSAQEHGYACATERLVLDAGRYYHVFALLSRASAGGGWTDGAFCLGPAGRPTEDLDRKPPLPSGALAEIGRLLAVGNDPLLPGYLRWRSEALRNRAIAAGGAGSSRGMREAEKATRLADDLARAAELLTADGERCASERGHGV